MWMPVSEKEKMLPIIAGGALLRFVRRTPALKNREMPTKTNPSPEAACPVCCDAFTAKIRVPVRCPSCSYDACVRCIKTYLLSSLSDPSCMNCGLHFNRTFLDEHLTPTWRNGELKKHREKVLFDRERSLIPATQPHVEREANRRQLDAARQQAHEEYRAALVQVRHCRNEHSSALRSLWNFNNERGNPAPPERRSFVAACPTEECKGFLSSQYKCGTCLKHFCSACRELKTSDHECDPGTVESIKAILQDSRACPGCGMSINRVSGCDQMYCTQCDVPFSYATGLRIQGVIHNPHYFERLRQLRERADAEGAQATLPPAVAREMQEGCGRWPSMVEFRWIKEEDRCMLTSFHRTATNIEHTVLPRLIRFNRGREDNVDLRVQYCLNELEESRFKMRLEQRERQREFDVDVRECLQLFVLLSIELAYRLRALEDQSGRVSQAHEMLVAHIVQAEELVNKPLRDISKRFKKNTPMLAFPEMWIATDVDLCVVPGMPIPRRRVMLRGW